MKMAAIEEVDWEQGDALATLLLNPSTWAFRRVESIEFVDVHTVRRRVSLDFDVGKAPDLKTMPKVVPLALLARETLVDFDLFDASGDRVSLLTATQGRLATYWALAALARRVLGRPPAADTLQDLHALASTTDEVKAAEIVARWAAATTNAEWGALLAHPGFGRRAYTFPESFILFAAVEGAGRRILKFRYLMAVEESHGARLVRVLGSVGWVPVKYFFRTPGPGDTASYHLEVAAPDGLTLLGADLWVHPAEREYELPAVARVPRFRTIAHFAVSGGAPEDHGVALLRVGAPPASLVTLAAATCLLVAVLLSVVAAFPSDQVSDLREATSILLAFPGLLTLAALRTGEHPLLRYVLSGVRAIVIACGVAALLAAFQIATGLKTVCLHDILWPTGSSPCVSPTLGGWASIAWVCAALLLPTLLRAVAGPWLATRFHWYGTGQE